ncbi:MAG TPA: diguanylate cyclase, partial [Pirellulaceae bacterium]|nr:diguanylate cyclase [Pirellulaceae bacterium]
MGIVQKLYFGLMTIAAMVTISATVGVGYTGPIAAALGVLSALALFFIIKRSIDRPVHALLTAANEFSKGNFKHRILAQRKDELGILSQAFNRMGEDLQRYSQQIRIATEAAAYQDPLTALANRTSILHSIQESIERQDGNHFALLFMDFDRFKLINDSLGHEMGDELLRQIARRIQGALRATDRVAIPARLGGDEFVVLLDDLPSVEESHAVAERLLDVLSQSYDLDGQ